MVSAFGNLNFNGYANPYYNQELMQTQSQNMLKSNLEFQGDYALKQAQLMNKNNGEVNILKTQALTLMSLLKNRQQDQFIDEWKEFEKLVSQNELYANTIDTSDPQELTAQARDVFHQITGNDLIASVNKVKTPFENSLINFATLGFAWQNENCDTLASKLTNTQRTSASCTAEATGAGIGVASAVGLTSMLIGGVKSLAVGCNPGGFRKWAPRALGLSALAGITTFIVDAVLQFTKRNKEISESNKG